MAEQLQLRRGTTAENDAFTGASGELTADTTLNELRLHDGSTAGGHTIGAGGAADLDDLGDVTITSPATGAVLTYNGSAWIDGTVALGDTDAVSGTLAVANGGTGDTTASGARTNLGFGTDILRANQVWLASPGAGVTLSDVAAADAFLSKSNRNVQKVDLTDFTQVRMTVRVTTGATAGTKLVATYHTAFSTTLTDFVAIGTSAVECALSATGTITSSWIDLAAGAKADVFTTIKQTGGDGATDPVIAFLELQFRRR